MIWHEKNTPCRAWWGSIYAFMLRCLFKHLSLCFPHTNIIVIFSISPTFRVHEREGIEDRNERAWTFIPYITNGRFLFYFKNIYTAYFTYLYLKMICYKLIQIFHLCWFIFHEKKKSETFWLFELFECLFFNF